MDKEMEEICHYLQGKGFVSVSQPNYRIQIYTKGFLTVVVEDKELEQLL